MTISTSYLTLGNLVLNPFPTHPLANHVRHVCRFIVANVIKLQYDRIGHSAVHAWMLLEKISYALPVTPNVTIYVCPGSEDIFE